MSNVMAVIRKELKGYFNSPIAYIFIIVFLTLSSWLFFRGFFLIGQADMRPFFSLMPWIFLFFVPAVSMRLWAEERKLGTVEILMTLPLKDWETVLGKFLAGLTLIGIALLLSISIPITVSYLGNPDPGPIVGGYVGTLLLGAAYLAIGLFASTLTENQIIAFIIGVVFCFIMLIVGEEIVLFSVPSFLTPIFRYIGLAVHFSSIGRGVIDSRDIIYYLSVISFFLYLSVHVVQSRRWR
ncbi:ABC transporter permease [Candidatus Poribacteria bacterium]|nr:ABC transporter permease [Candidatus Poribacteria bacterium]